MTKVDFSLNLIMGLLIEYINSPLINDFSKFAIDNMFLKHPNIFNKISDDGKNVVIAICPVDIPYFFIINMNKNAPSMVAVKSQSKIYSDAKIIGNLKDLLLMFEGKIDGDAAFFSQKLKIEGNTTLILKIRNAIDSEEIDILKDFSESLYIFDNTFYNILKKSLLKYNKINDKLMFLVESATNKSVDISQNNSYKIYELEETIKNIQKKISKETRNYIRKKSDYSPKDIHSYNNLENVEENDDGYV